jgi:EmrB/QacA subfamily drug resistance transporter
MNADEQALHGSKKYQRRWFTLLVLSTVLLIIGLDVTVLNVALPTLQQELGASASQLLWIVNAYVLVFAGVLLTMGTLGDRFGRKLALQVGLVVFGAASVAAGFADSTTQLIVARAAQGIGGAMIMPSTLSVIVDVFPRSERPKAIGIWAGVSALGIPLGMVGGGWLLEQFSWGSVFLINAPVAIVALVAGQVLVPESKDPAARRIDVVGAVLSMATLTALIYTNIEAPGQGWLAPVSLVGFAGSFVGAAAFVWFELRTSEPMLDIRFFRNPRLSAGTAAVAVAFMAMLGLMFILTQYLQFVRGYTPLETGLRFVPMALGFMVGAPSSAMLVNTLGTKKLMSAGLLLVAAIMLSLSFLTLTTPYGVIGLLLLALGTGMACSMAPATDAVMAALPEEQAGVGSALNDTSRQIGGALGVGIFGSIFNSVYGTNVGSALAGLSEQAAAAAQNSIGAALDVATGLGAAGDAVRTASTAAFIDGLSVTFIVSAAIAFIGGLFVFRFMPAQDVTPTELAARVVHHDEHAGVRGLVRIPVED